MWWIYILFSILTVLIIIFIAILIATRNNDDSEKHSSHYIDDIDSFSYADDFLPANEKAGLIGEQYVNQCLTSLLKEDEYLLSNVLLPLKNGNTTEIDCILISHRGVYCIEIKNWIGQIIGNDSGEYWLQAYDDINRPVNEHRNPIKQNEAHCGVLKRKLNNRFEIFGAVIFANLECDSRIESASCFTFEEFKEYFLDLENKQLSKEEIKQIYQKLLPFVATQAQLKEHKKKIQESYKD